MKILTRLSVFSVLLLLLIACSSTPEPTAMPEAMEETPLNQGAQFSADVAPLLENYLIRPVDTILGGRPLEVSNFANDGTATLPIHTDVAVACTVNFGKDRSLGQLSLDQDMAGGTHSDHNPLLSGLEPETEYFYRVQGVDDAGTLYISDIMSFTTPPQDTSENLNLASAENGAEIIGFSSAFGGAGVDETWGAGMAFDGSPNSEWSSAGDGNDAWVEVKLAQRSLITSVEFQTRSMSNGTAITKQFSIITDSGEEFGPFDLPDASQMYQFDVEIEAETLRFNLMDTTGGNTGVVDIAVYGTASDG